MNQSPTTPTPESTSLDARILMLMIGQKLSAWENYDEIKDKWLALYSLICKTEWQARATAPDAAKDAQRERDRLDAERYRKICRFNSYLDDLFDCCVEKSDYDKLLDRMTLAAPDQGDV